MREDADLVWNRAALREAVVAPLAGDVALADMLEAHGLVMNGGVLHAIECLSGSELELSGAGYRFFGLSDVADLLRKAHSLDPNSPDIDLVEGALDEEYVAHVPNDTALVERFSRHLAAHPELYAPSE